MHFDDVMNTVHTWLTEISEKYKNKISIEIMNDNNSSFIVNFETERFIAQLTVNDGGFQPFRFVEFHVLDSGKSVNQPPAYLYHDNDESTKDEIINNLNDCINFISGSV